MGIYVIICWANLNLYVGQTTSFNARWREHRSKLELCVHENPRLQNAWNKYGEAAFEFGIYKKMPGATAAEMLEVERAMYHLWDGDRFNIVLPGTPPGYLLRGRALSEDHKSKLRASAKGFSPEVREAQRQAVTGKPLSTEHRNKIRAALRGVPKSPEHIEAARQGQVGKPKSEAHRKALREAWKRRQIGSRDPMTGRFL